jgi:hypothetical protein
VQENPFAGLKPVYSELSIGVAPKVCFSVILNEVKNLKALLFRFFASLRMTTVLLLRQPLLIVPKKDWDFSPGSGFYSFF